MGDVLVPAEITQEVTQILSNLVLGDNQIRSSAEKAVNDRLEHTPELYLLAIAQFATSADTELVSPPPPHLSPSSSNRPPRPRCAPSPSSSSAVSSSAPPLHTASPSTTSSPHPPSPPSSASSSTLSSMSPPPSSATRPSTPSQTSPTMP
ncbi:hypothetical protein C8Q79DRAFT_967516 [Trametes meyenii]|nr:hypothetical protein C8Q79DRAFT_967516 [Trametes meyenii]